jgi:3'(2'), 5'-bisphosphate nucleotidase / inositol polyphosphate 1-phosphatase
MISYPELKTAIQAVNKACSLCMGVQRDRAIDTVQKMDRSPVTIADIGSQAVITIELQKEFPDDPVVGEEDTHFIKENETLRKKILALVNTQVASIEEKTLIDIIAYGTREIDYSGRFWTVDPIDGTKGFLRGDQYAVALGLVENGEVVAGVLGCPNLPHDIERPEAGKGCIFFAKKGGGAFFQHIGRTNEQKLSVNRKSDLSQARFCESVEESHVSHDTHAEISSRLGITAAPYRIDSQCKYAAVGRGDASIYLRLPRDKDYREKIWDHAAGSIIVTEAGGLVTDFLGNVLDFSTGRKLSNSIGLVATTGNIHERVLNAIAEVLHIGTELP